MNKLSNWTYGEREIKEMGDFPAGCVGFVYLIQFKNGMSYIGKKSLVSITHPKISKSTYDRLKKEGKMVIRKRSKKTPYVKEVIKETNWKTYKGSPKNIPDSVKKSNDIRRKILKFCYNKKQLTYYEAKFQMCLSVIEENNDLYYNGNILGKYFPKDLIL